MGQRIILRWTLNKENVRLWAGVPLAQDGVQGRALVNTVLNLGFHKRRGISWLNEQLSASQELSSMELVLSKAFKRIPFLAPSKYHLYWFGPQTLNYFIYISSVVTFLFVWKVITDNGLLLISAPSVKCKKFRRKGIWMGHISFWSRLMIICSMKTNTIQI
jgi:hypothetical protein